MGLAHAGRAVEEQGVVDLSRGLGNGDGGGVGEAVGGAHHEILEGKDVPLVSEEPSDIRRYRCCRLCHYYNACKAKQPERQRWKVCEKFKDKTY